MAKLTHDFFNGDTVAIAQALLGKYLVRNRNGELLAGRITETEAYVGRCDKACHAYNYRRTPRTETLFMAPGHALHLFHLRDVPLSELRHGAGGRTFCRAAAGTGTDGGGRDHEAPAVRGCAHERLPAEKLSQRSRQGL